MGGGDRENKNDAARRFSGNLSTRTSGLPEDDTIHELGYHSSECYLTVSVGAGPVFI